MIPDKPVAQLIHGAAVPFDDEVEGAGPSGQAGLYQAGFVEIGQCGTAGRIDRRTAGDAVAPHRVSRQRPDER